MAVTLNEPVQVGANAYLLTWSSDVENATFYLFRNGVPFLETKTTSHVFTMTDRETHDIEVFDDATDVPRGAVPPSAVLRWQDVSGADDYVVEQFIDAVWTPIGDVRDVGAGQNSLLVSALADATQHDFRVSARNPRGSSTPTPVDFTMVRVPDAPENTMAFSDSTKVLTVTAV